MAGSSPKTEQQPASPLKISSDDSTSIKVKIGQRQSQELVIAFSGPLGSGIDKVIEHFETCAQRIEYEVVKIDLSSKIKEAFKILHSTQPPDDLPEDLKGVDLDSLTGAERYRKLQDAGNYLRSKNERDILAQYAIEEIIYKRAKKAQKEYEELKAKGEIDPSVVDLAKYTVEVFVPAKTIYIIDQLKNDAEVELLKDVYGDLFYLIGILCSETERLKNLQSKDIPESDAHDIMARDKKQEDDFGQQLEKTLNHSDYFIRNSEFDRSDLESKLTRFLDIIHNIGVITPTVDEHAMYIAHSAALKSACLSKQVGASITNPNGQIISTGCNDVPKFGGGLYTIDDKKDLRCHNSGSKCYNDDFKKRRIKEQIESVLDEHNIANKEAIVQQLFKRTRLKDLIEFSRAIHAEMDAITSLARTGHSSTIDCTLYSTTYPCHNCARHIVAAGIKRVIYIEPYEKSLATDLHGDSITNDQDKSGKVAFVHFEGVSPRKYQDFFLSNTERKTSTGALIKQDSYVLKSKIHPYLDSYRTLESKVSQHLQSSKSDPQ